MELNARMKEVLIYFALKYKGDWKRIYEAINLKEEVEEKSIQEEIAKVKCNIVTIIDENYPKQLKNIYQPPFVLFYYGDLSLLDNHFILGIVGSREVSDYGKKSCNKIIDEIRKEDVVILSGLAKGIDSLAHEGAIRNNLKTVAVLGTGIDYCYPKENFYLYREIKKNGLLISEYPYKELVNKNSFALRNRLIAGLSSKIFVPDVQDKSGTIITIRFGLNYGKEILVLPCSIFESMYNNYLIFQGATPILDGKDIFE